MKKGRSNINIFFYIEAVILLVVIIFLPLGLSDFILPQQGGGMIHCDPQMSDNIRLPVPIKNATTNIGIVWYRYDLGGEKVGTLGNGIAGNGKIAASTFGLFNLFGGPLFPNDNLIIYDYYGNHLWSSGWWKLLESEYPWSLNTFAFSSTPAIDIQDRVIACDNQKIIMVNASNRGNIHVQWITNYSTFSNSIWKHWTPVSPTIVENKTIVLPILNGPVYAFKADTGEKIGEIYLGENTTIDPYWGIPKMNSSDFLTFCNISLNDLIYNLTIFCPYHYNSSNHTIVWNCTVHYGLMPLNPPYYEGTIMLQADPHGFVTATETTNNTIMAENYLSHPGIITGDGFFSTQNSVCSKGNMVYVSTQYEKPGYGRYNNSVGRLYALNVNPDPENGTNALSEAWNLSYYGVGQASPTLINNTIYFDGFNNTLLPGNRDPHVYAVYTNGTIKWSVPYNNTTGFSFTMDPRGGFWYEDNGIILFGGPGGRKLVHFNENGNITEEIDIATLMGKPGEYIFPNSCMTTCGTNETPIMLISANKPWFQKGKWVVAINLSNNNTPLWNVSINPPLNPEHFPSNLNVASGQYTILRENNQSRILFGTLTGGVMAIGDLSNCWFQNIDQQPKDSTNDINTYNDTVQVNYTIKNTLPDRVWIKAILISLQHPILCRYKTEKHYNISTPNEITNSFNITLPDWAPMGYYLLRVLLYNSSGETNRGYLNISDYTDFGIYANDTYWAGPFFLYPPDDPPSTPHQPWGDTQVLTNETTTYTSHTTDPNNDSIWYQWKYETRIGPIPYTYYTRWIMGGHHESGENDSRNIHWSFPGTYNVWVRAKDNLLNPNVMSDWSTPRQVTVSKSDDGASWDTDLLATFTSTLVTENQQTSCNGFATGVIIQNTQRGSLNWTWDFDDGNISYGENISHSYRETGNYTVNMTLQNGLGETSNFTTTISVGLLRADFTIIGDAQPEKTVHFNDASTSVYQLVNWTWDFDDGTTSYQRNTSYIYRNTGEYNVTLTVKDILNNTHIYAKPIFIEPMAPVFISVVDNSDPVGLGNDETISVDFFDNQSGVKTVMINIASPENTTIGNFTMQQNVSSEHDYVYVFNDTWQTGVYNYSIWVVDNANNTNYVSGFNFTVSAEADISITTTKNSYTGTEYINLTDPPSNPSPSLGYELVDNGTVLHLWNQYDNYYFNTSSGIQLTNHYDKYWSHNVLMLGYYTNNQWNVIYRTDELTGFTKNIQTDNVSFVNVTLWKDLTYNGYAFRLAIRYHLGPYDNELTVIPFIKNLGNPIPYTLGFAWEINDIQVAMTPENDYLEINGTQYLLNESLDINFNQLSDPAFQINEVFPDGIIESLSLRWSNSLNYQVWVKSQFGEYNAPVVLGIKIGTLGIGQEKYTELLWHDACQVTYYFNHHDPTEVWATNPDNMVDGNISKYASTTIQSDVEVCDNNTCNGSSLGTITKVELRAYGYCSYGHRDIILKPVFNDRDHGSNYSYSPSFSPAWSGWFDITNDPGRGSGGLGAWSWNEIKNLDCNVTSQYISGGSIFNLLCSKIELQVTYGNAPVISNPSPPYGVNGVSLQPWVNITVFDPNGDRMNVTWYSNSTPSLLTLRLNANGSTTQLERYPTSQNANYKCVDETITDDSDYVKWKGSTWKKDTYNLLDHTNQTGTIHTVTVWARCARVGTVTIPKTNSSAQIVIRTDGTDYYGNEFIPPYSSGFPTTTYANYTSTWTINPATGNAWSWTDIDNLQAGISFIGTEGTSRCSQLYVMVNYTNPLTWLQFGRNNSVGNGTFRQRFLNASVNGEWWFWKVKADDGTLSTWSSVYKFYTGYQSKIENCGDTNISGYVLMQVQFYNTSQSAWLLDNDTVNETSVQIINSGSQLGLDDFFNGKIRASDLQHGSGTYRVYAAFRDPNCNILTTNDGTELKAWWEFTKI